ncbi:hypothetical protein FHL15_002168 [Xylaria flabelliformis]|uniref:Cytochrome P450 n=1 Tax=Xylaria flabelliformis TaxID=2512241 RepID=A0A553I9L1_9PEZI|nr:hypothetical protein FHL15_002168 [Xylaria flabelliformis]
MVKEIDTFIKHLFDLSKSDAPVNMTPMCRHLSYDTAAHLGFGCSLNLQTDPTNRFLPKAISIGNLRINICMNFPLLMKWRLHQRIADNVPNSLRDRFFEALNNMITARLSQPIHAKHDLCSFMAKSMGKEEQEPDRLDLVTEAVFFFPAAAEVRSTFQSGTDIRGGARLARCKYLRACIDEALRISPPATGLMWRELASVEKEDDKESLVIDGHVIPHGTQVSVSIYSLHHNAEYFPDPFIFRPERWLEDSEDNEATRKAMSDAFAPFLVGSRSCAGKPMAYLEVSLTLAKTLWYFDFEPSVGDSGHLGGGTPTGLSQHLITVIEMFLPIQERVPARKCDSEHSVRSALLADCGDNGNQSIDLHLDNLLIALRDDSMMAEMEEVEMAGPSPRKQTDDRTIHTSRMMMGGGGGPLTICDLGHAHIGEKHHGFAMPTQYRAPEVIFGLGPPRERTSFRIYDNESPEQNDAHHLAAMTALLGPPPPEFLIMSEKTAEFWSEDNEQWKGPVPLLPETSFESLAGALTGEEKEMSVSWMDYFLYWLPEERGDATQIIFHPFIGNNRPKEEPEEIRS